MDYSFTTIGALIGMAVAIILIIKKVQPAYSLIFGALIGGVIGSGNLILTVDTMVSGAQSMISSVLRIMTSGILAGTLIKTGAAEKIAEVIVQKLGEKRALIAVAAATMVICAVGVFVDISVITVAPIALAIGKKAGYNKASLLLAMIGGGKAGNIISPNPNTIAVSEAFQVDLTSLMIKNIIPAVCALIVTVIIATILSKKAGTMVSDQDLEKHADNKKLPTFIQAFAGPLTVIILLALRPIFSIVIDPLIALPLGGLVCAIACGSLVQFREFAEFGLSKVAGVSILLIGTGTIAGIIKASALQYDVISLLEMMKMPAFILAPIAGILMAGATASTTAGATIASQTFAQTLLNAGIPAISAGAMIHAGATVIDSLPHGSFFHATGGSVGMNIKERMKLIPFEACIGLTSTIVAVIVYLI
ncbi:MULTISPECIES: GntP family permease [Blautia]|uniref:GntP family permease n=1 Tax=Blautia TaxID=572511 RepID=UPI000E489C18|nr:MULTISPECIES: SLC13 family permease [Blautia]MDD7418237.1 SLC13 family permease [Ruminococcus sp.]RHQ48213.1 GntP family permease [Ruminococcus sp. AF25-23LB]RHT16502.1 GntP family permease [Ruminococcus sp. AM34-9LB]MDB6458999.1 SLC13 family permease [Blautia wexlerae]MDB6462348.1 SLC13 family permease [Blautia wexlerae]